MKNLNFQYQYLQEENKKLQNKVDYFNENKDTFKVRLWNFTFNLLSGLSLFFSFIAFIIEMIIPF